MTKCQHCDKRAYNVSGEKRGRFCAEHRSPDMVDVKNKTCEETGCETRPVYNVRGEKRGRFCNEHRSPDMVDVKNKTCEEAGCDTQPRYNIRGEKRGRFCAEHCSPDMVNVMDKTCEEDGCETIPVYNIRGEKKARFCTEHRSPDMVNVKDKTCEEDGCETRPAYNIRGEKKARFCTEHRSPDMVNVISKTCEEAGCEKQPAYNIRWEKKGRFCTEHRSPDMVDVKHKTCEENGCKTRAHYGWIGKGTSRCGYHRQKGMITSPNRKCESACCHHLGTHEANGMRLCEDHSPANAENLGVETCSSCGLDDILTNGKCGTCDPHIIQMRRHVKENRVKDLFTVSGFTFVHDRMLESTLCGRERPDFQFDCGTHFVYVEVDENQHRSYACECEQGRMINLVHVRGMPVRWIRYNPDVYEPMEGQRKVKLEQREKKLVEHVKWAMKHSPSEDRVFSNVLYLYYDEYDSHNSGYQKLL